MPLPGPHKIGQPVEGERLEQWCVDACADSRDWFVPEERFHAVRSFEHAVQERYKRGGKREIPYKSINIEGDPGAGKSAGANYVAAAYRLKYGTEHYGDGTMGYGIELTDGEMMAGFPRFVKGATFFTDEANLWNRKGRDQADVQQINSSRKQIIRKGLLYDMRATASQMMLGSVDRSSADELWCPTRMQVQYTDEERRRLGRAGRGQGGRGKNNPANFAYAMLKCLDSPFRKKSVFDQALGKYRHPKAPLPVYATPLEVKWMRQVMPLVDSFKDAPVAVALGLDRQAVVDIALGRDAPADAGEEQALTAVAQLIRAFQAGTIPQPNFVAAGGHYQPQHLTVTALRNASGSMLGNAKFSRILREELGLSSTKDRGYELGELWAALAECIEVYGDRLDAIMAGLEGQSAAAWGGGTGDALDDVEGA